MTPLEQRLGELRLRFVDRALRDRLRLQAALETGEFAEAEQICHRLAGLAGTFGFHQAGDAAAALEEALEQGSRGAALAAPTRHLLGELASLNAEAA